MMTKTRRQNLIKALRKTLFISTHQAIQLIEDNWISLANGNEPFHDIEIVAHQGNADPVSYCGYCSIYLGGQFLMTICVGHGLMKRLTTVNLARAYGLPEDLCRFYEADLEAQEARRALRLAA